jgi:energy-coupling factor transport system ATP-binding protein
VSAAPAAVRARGWGWRHAGRRRWAVKGLDLDIAPGERVLLLGASGAGKSTLLLGLAGLLGDAEDGDAEGSLTIDGVASAAARGRAGLVLQDPDAQTVLARAGDDVAFGCENLGVARDEIWPRVDAALAAVGLPIGRAHPTAQLSGGQKQRLALAGVLAMRPGLVLLDEPTANVDPAGAIEVRDAVAAATASTGATLVVVEHRVALWADVVDRVVVLGEEGLLADGAPSEVFARHGAALTGAGVWVPGADTDLPRRTAVGGGEVLLEAGGLAVGRARTRRAAPRVAASGIDVAVAAGRTLAVTGANGAGKSTLALTLAGLLPPAGGMLTATAPLAQGLGAHPHRWAGRELLTRIGMVFQQPEHQLLTARVRDELAVGPRALGRSAARIAADVDDLVDRLGLARLADVNPFTLSGGEKRRLTVAAALATRPRVLVLDEPTFGQDARTWREIARLIDDVRADGAAIVAVTHDEALVDALTDERLELEAAT